MPANNPTFNIFGPSSRCDIRVGYISTTRGYVDNLSVYDANKHAQLDPGTTFIFKTRDVIRYLNINEVNALNPNELVPKSAGSSCEGPKLNLDEPSPPHIVIYGGGGVGAQANPVIGNDGSLLAIDMVRHGYGYHTAPNFELRDGLGRGAGAIIRGNLCDPVATTYINYDQEDDYEDYDFTTCSPVNLKDYGVRYSPSGKPLGKWDPTIFANLSKDPIRAEIQEYQDYLARGLNPWWTTRNQIPLSITSSEDGLTKRTKWDVTHMGWSPWLNTYAISPVSPSNAPGSDHAGSLYTFMWEEEFPYDGQYVFKALRDNTARVYLDNVLMWDLQTSGFNHTWQREYAEWSTHKSWGSEPFTKKKNIKAGVHKIRVDLSNLPVKKKILIPEKVTESLVISYPISYIAMKSAFKFNPRFINDTTLKFDDDPDNGWDTNATLTCSGKNARFSNTGKLLYGEGDVSVNLTWDDNPKKSGRAIQGVVINGIKWTVTAATRGSETHTVKMKGAPVAAAPQVVPADSTVTGGIQIQNVFNTVEWIGKANRQLWRTNVYSRGGFINENGVCPFDTNQMLNDNPYAGSHKIVWNNVKFPFDGNYSIEVAVDDNVSLTFKKDGMDEVRIRKEGFSPGTSNSTGPSTYVRAFKKGTYQLIADLEQIPGGRFGFAPIPGAPTARGNVNPKFIRSGNNFYLDVAGSGSAKLDFIAKSSDSPSSGFAAKEVQIQSDSGMVKLKRNLSKENETIRATGVFSAGNRYRINIIGGATQGKGRHLRNDKTIEMFDAGGDSFDFELILSKVSNELSASLKGINPMALAVNVKAAYTIEEVVSPRSWQQNPMGIALTIDAPMPPIPQEPVETGEGRCPRNPTWTTRFPGASQQWWPVGGDTRWSAFMNRYALSPVPPFGTENSESSGTTFTNSWPLVIDYDGYYGVKGTRDNRGKVLINGRTISELDSFKTEDPNTTKVYLSKGNHTVSVQVSNERQNTYKIIDQKVFNTADWAVAQQSTTVTENIPAGVASHSITYSELHKSNDSIRVVDNNTKIELKDGHGNDPNVKFIIKAGDAKFSSDGRSISGSGEVVIEIDYNDSPGTAGEAVRSITINGTVWRKKNETRGGETHKINLGSPSVNVDKQVNTGPGLVSGAAKGGVTYEGPPLASYRQEGLGPSLTPAWKDDEDFRTNFMGKEWTSIWRGVNFPSNNQYTLRCLADDGLRVYIDGVEIGNPIDSSPSASFSGSIASPVDFAAEVFEGIRTYNFNVSKGIHDVKLAYFNIPGNNQSTFWTNPVSFSAIITVKKRVIKGTESWTNNPIAIAAKIIPPPCPRIVRGKGTVCDPDIIHVGVGYTPSTNVVGFSTYNVSVNLTDISIVKPGIGYDCTKDKIIIEPSNGAVARPICGEFGQITGIDMVSVGIGFTGTPSITMTSDTGSGFTGIPVMPPVRDPVPEPEPHKLIQVTDLVGLKQTGYYNGRPYYGAVFYKEGIRYAGYYETAGQLIQIYDTMQESIDARVTTPPSAIQRQGTDITSNDPRLDIPGTPDNLI
jgi:hypothetical protein